MMRDNMIINDYLKKTIFHGKRVSSMLRYNKNGKFNIPTADTKHIIMKY